VPYLARLVANLPPTPFDDPGEGAYLDLLDRVIVDRIVSAEEARVLERTAIDWGLTRAMVFEAHQKYLRSIVAAAEADGVITEAELHDLEVVCDLLGMHRAALIAALRALPGKAIENLTRALVSSLATSAETDRRTAPLTRGGLKGRSVCFTGTFMGKLGGKLVTRDQVEKLATEAGLKVRASVSKQLDILVAADVESLSSKAKRARKMGIRVIDEVEFWQALDAGVVVERR